MNWEDDRIEYLEQQNKEETRKRNSEFERTLFDARGADAKARGASARYQAEQALWEEQRAEAEKKADAAKQASEAAAERAYGLRRYFAAESDKWKKPRNAKWARSLSWVIWDSLADVNPGEAGSAKKIRKLRDPDSSPLPKSMVRFAPLMDALQQIEDACAEAERWMSEKNRWEEKARRLLGH